MARSKSLGKKEQAERTRERILDSAVGLFATRGFASTSTKDLARAVGMTPGVLYWHFKSKEDLLIAVLDRLFDKTFADIARGAGTLDEQDPAMTLEVLIQRVARIIESNADTMQMIGVVSVEATDTMPRVEATIRAAYGRLAELLERVLERAAPSMQHAPPLEDMRCAAQMFMGMYMGAFLHQRLFRREYPLSRSFAVVRRMLLGAVLPGAAAKARRRRH